MSRHAAGSHVRCKAFHGSKQCTAIATLADMCSSHLDSVQGLRIGKSTIPGAGQGLFTTVARKVGDLIGFYRGTIHKEAVQGDYVISNGTIWVDASKLTDCAARFANMAVELRNGPALDSKVFKNNAIFEDWDEICLVASATMQVGDEIFADYGSTYFTKSELDTLLFTIPEDVLKSNKPRRKSSAQILSPRHQKPRGKSPRYDENLLFSIPNDI